MVLIGGAIQDSADTGGDNGWESEERGRKRADGALCSGMIFKILPSSFVEVFPVLVGL